MRWDLSPFIVRELDHLPFMMGHPRCLSSIYLGKCEDMAEKTGITGGAPTNVALMCPPVRILGLRPISDTTSLYSLEYNFNS